MTREPLSSRSLIVNRALKSQIEGFLIKSGVDPAQVKKRAGVRAPVLVGMAHVVELALPAVFKSLHVAKKDGRPVRYDYAGSNLFDYYRGVCILSRRQCERGNMDACPRVSVLWCCAKSS